MKKEALTVIVFGGTGDLAKRKLVPAFSRLIHNGVIKQHSTLIGISRAEMSDEEYRKLLKQTISDPKEKKHIDELNIKYLSMDFSDPKNIKKLAGLLPACEIGGCNRIYYLATGYRLFPGIVKGLKNYNLITKGDRFSRIVFEKPFGRDMKSGDKLDRDIHKVIDENQIFRIDHYLGKESVQNILRLKTGNSAISKIMSNKNIESIQLTVDETLGVGNRIGYYDNAGAIKDMIQNHLLQVLALVLIEPCTDNDKAIHREKLKVLGCLSPKNNSEHLLGQYESYKNEAKKFGVKSSKIETFAKIKMECGSKRWKGIDLILRTGKKLPKKYGQILIKLKDNRGKIVIDLQPIQGIHATIDGKEFSGRKVCISCNFKPNTPDAYEILFRDVINNNRRLFVTSDEIHEAWRIVDKIEKDKSKIKFVSYKDCTNPEKSF